MCSLGKHTGLDIFDVNMIMLLIDAKAWGYLSLRCMLGIIILKQSIVDKGIREISYLFYYYPYVYMLYVSSLVIIEYFVIGSTIY